MSRKRGARRRTAANPQAYLLAIAGKSPVPKEQQLKRGLEVRMAVDAVTSGQADREAWALVFDMINLIEELCSDPAVAQGAEEFVAALQAAMVRMVERQQEGGFSVSADDVALLNEAVALFVELLGRVTYGQVIKAQGDVVHRLRERLAATGETYTVVMAT